MMAYIIIPFAVYIVSAMFLFFLVTGNRSTADTETEIHPGEITGPVNYAMSLYGTRNMDEPGNEPGLNTVAEIETEYELPDDAERVNMDNSINILIEEYFSENSAAESENETSAQEPETADEPEPETPPENEGYEPEETDEFSTDGFSEIPVIPESEEEPGAEAETTETTADIPGRETGEDNGIINLY